MYTIEKAIIAKAKHADRPHAVAELLVAEREFGRSRRKAVLRSLLSGLGLGNAAHSIIRAGEGDELRVGIDSIIGLAEDSGRSGRALGPMPRELLREWCETYLRMGSEDEDWPMRLRPNRGAWLLVGGGAALVKLEMLRLRGFGSVRARIDSPTDSRGEEAASFEGCCAKDAGAA
jgi:hypothetical protein